MPWICENATVVPTDKASRRGGCETEWRSLWQENCLLFTSSQMVVGVQTVVCTLPSGAQTQIIDTRDSILTIGSWLSDGPTIFKLVIDAFVYHPVLLYCFYQDSSSDDNPNRSSCVLNVVANRSRGSTLAAQPLAGGASSVAVTIPSFLTPREPS